MTYCDWICSDCGHKYGRPRDGVATWHYGQCDWCGARKTPVTEPRDFGYPEMPEKKE